MGARNVNAALTMFPELPDHAMRLLLGMAQRSWDEPVDGDPARTYWGGQADMLRIMGGDHRRSAVYRALTVLKNVGAVTQTETGSIRDRRRAVFILNLTEVRDVKPRPGKGSTSDTYREDVDTRIGPTSETQIRPTSETNTSHERDEYVPEMRPLGEPTTREEQRPGRNLEQSQPSPGFVIALDAIRAARAIG